MIFSNRPTGKRFISSLHEERICFLDSAIGNPSSVSQTEILSLRRHLQAHPCMSPHAGPELPGGTAYSINPSQPKSVSVCFGVMTVSMVF